MIFMNPMMFGGSTAIEAEADPYFANVSLLMHMDGVDDGAVFTDVKGKSISRVGNVLTKTTIKQFGTASGYFIPSVWLSIGATTDFAFGTGDFTIEFWLYYISTLANASIMSKRNPSSIGAGAWGIAVTGTTIVWQDTLNGGADKSVTGLVNKTNAWRHVAVSRSSGTLKIFADGVQVFSTSSTINYSNGYFLGVNKWDVSSYTTFYIDELRITQGVARYTSNFTPTTLVFPDF